MEMATFEEVAAALGSNSGALKLAISLYSGYLFSGFYRRFLHQRPPKEHHLYFTAVALPLLYWNFGYDLAHSLFCIFCQWLFFQILGPSLSCVTLSFLFQMGYLFMGYIMVSTETYQFTWTMPQCVLTLRLIGLSFDVYDGHRNQEEVTPEQKTTMICDIPSFLEICGYTYFVGGFLIGPQFPLTKYRSLVNGEMTDSPCQRPNNIKPAVQRCLIGSAVLALQIVANIWFPQKLYFSTYFTESTFFSRICLIFVRSHLFYLRYCAVWMIVEGVCILSGISFCMEHDQVKWTGVRNIKFRQFLCYSCFLDIVVSFNVGTNLWAKRYIYQRLKFLGNRLVSHASVLFFLSVWHGYHEGFHLFFAMQFALVNLEKKVVDEMSKSQAWVDFNSIRFNSWVAFIFKHLYVKAVASYVVTYISLRKWQYFIPVQRSVFYFGHIMLVLAFVTLYLWQTLRKKQKLN